MISIFDNHNRKPQEYNTLMTGRRNSIFVILVIFAVVVITSLPYLFAASRPGPGFLFGGVLLNPIDGNSYLAKMYQGWQGHWLVDLPYTAQPGARAFLFPLYLFLGHVARWGGIPLIGVYHLARIIGTIFMLWAIYNYYQAVLTTPGRVRLALLLAAIGSGAGWLASFTGVVSSDFWVAEAYPFLSAYTNPHFPIGLALCVWLLTPRGNIAHSRLLKNDQLAHDRSPIAYRVKILVGSLLLGLVSPFGIVVVLAVSCAEFVWQISTRMAAGQPIDLFRQLQGSKIVAVALGGGPVLSYDLWVIRTDPVLAGWNAQNQTPAPPGSDFLIAFAPVFIAGLVGLAFLLKRPAESSRLKLIAFIASLGFNPNLNLIVWAGLGCALLYIPFSLQRRFLLGLYVPWAGLAAEGICSLSNHHPRWRSLILAGVFILAIPTNLFVLLAGVHGVITHDQRIYLTFDEAQAMDWIRTQSAESALFLSAPETGLFIPAHTGRRVIYGHPFETVNATANRDLVVRYFSGQAAPGDLELLKPVDYVFWGPRERQLGPQPADLLLEAVFKNTTVTIYQAP